MSLLFQDKSGNMQEVNLVFNVGVRRQIATKLGPGSFADILQSDLMSDDKTVDCYYECCKHDLDTLGISKDDFERQIDGEKLQQLEDAFLKAVENFTPPREREERMAALIAGREKVKAVKKKLIDNMMAKIKRLKNRHIRRQQVETAIRCRLLNHFTALGRILGIHYTQVYRLVRQFGENLPEPEVLPSERHVIGKQHTVIIERDNSNTHHHLGRFTRRTKVVSKSQTMVDLSLRIWHALTAKTEIFQSLRNTIDDIFR